MIIRFMRKCNINRKYYCQKNSGKFAICFVLQVVMFLEQTFFKRYYKFSCHLGKLIENTREWNRF